MTRWLLCLLLLACACHAAHDTVPCPPQRPTLDDPVGPRHRKTTEGWLKA